MAGTKVEVLEGEIGQLKTDFEEKISDFQNQFTSIHEKMDGRFAALEDMMRKMLEDKQKPATLESKETTDSHGRGGNLNPFRGRENPEEVSLDIIMKKRSPLRQVFIGDVVVMKDPEKPNDCIVRRLAAVEGYEMASKNEKDEPFILEKDQCWVLSDDESLKPKEARDSRLFGPVPMSGILGRVIYAMRSAVDHGPVQNSHLAMDKDTSVLSVELDVDEMAKNLKT
ncbi:hypothetical protein M5K25_001912 [Dendrobium thyrsiflorum]|uniref:Mitochondrial inner membrane protease subunit 1 n=1 Tax=Dendrobium thyrsiflorum TaxID=117978 RepID=A0ABD0W1Q5_DENTH